MYAIAPGKEKFVDWFEETRTPFTAPKLKISVSKDIEKAHSEFNDALQELERLLQELSALTVFDIKDNAWAIATKVEIDAIVVNWEPWAVPALFLGKLLSDGNQIEIYGVLRTYDKANIGAKKKIFVLRSKSDWKKFESQIELCKETGDRFKVALEQKLPQNILGESKPALTVISGGKIEEFSQSVDVEVVESRPLSQEEQEFYGLLPSKTRNWLLNEMEPEISTLQREENQYRAAEFEFRQKATEVARQRGKRLLKVEEELSKIKVSTDNKYSKKNLYHIWLEIRYKEEMRCGSIKSAKQLALNDKKLAIDPDFARLPEEIINKFDQSAAVKLASKGNEDAKYRAIALAQDPEVKHISHSLASELIAEQSGRQTENKPKLPKINKSQTLNPTSIAEAAASEESEETSDIDNLRDVVKNGGTDDEIQMILDAIVAQRLDELKIEAKKKVWEETAREEAKEEAKETSRQFKEAIAELAKVKTERIQLQQQNAELEAKLAQVDEAEIVKENQALRRKVDEYAIERQAKKQVKIRYHHYEELGKKISDADILKMFQDLLARNKQLEEESLILKGATAVVENSPQLKPDGNVLIAETLPEELAIGN